MTDVTTTATVESTFAPLVATITGVRDVALGKETIGEAVGAAIGGTIAAIEEAQLTGGITSIEGLNLEVGKAWAEVVNS